MVSTRVGDGFESSRVCLTIRKEPAKPPFGGRISVGNAPSGRKRRLLRRLLDRSRGHVTRFVLINLDGEVADNGRKPLADVPQGGVLSLLVGF